MRHDDERRSEPRARIARGFRWSSCQGGRPYWERPTNAVEGIAYLWAFEIKQKNVTADIRMTANANGLVAAEKLAARRRW